MRTSYLAVTCAALSVCVALSACGPSPEAAAAENDAEMLADNLEAQADNMEAMADNIMAGGKASGAKDDGSGWVYDSTKDEMRGSVRKTATLSSSTTLNFDFPYGETVPSLHIRQDPKFGFDIFINSDGQPLCRSYQDDTFSVKFDNGPIREWSCAEADGGGSGTVFFNSERKLLGEIKRAKKMIVEVNFYNEGRRQIVFPVEGLKWS